MKRTLKLIPLLILILAASLRAELSQSPPGTVSIAIIPDTQRYRGKGTKAEPDSQNPVTNDVFHAYTSWIAENLETQRIIFVSHVGDIVDRNVREQWAVAREAMDRLHGRISYGISVGNHDMTRAGDSSLFQKKFPASRYTDLSWYGGSYSSPSSEAVSGNNAKSYQLFTPMATTSSSFTWSVTRPMTSSAGWATFWMPLRQNRLRDHSYEPRTALQASKKRWLLHGSQGAHAVDKAPRRTRQLSAADVGQVLQQTRESSCSLLR